jgi:hypothetical protein
MEKNNMVVGTLLLVGAIAVGSVLAHYTINAIDKKKA